MATKNINISRLLSVTSKENPSICYLKEQNAYIISSVKLSFAAKTHTSLAKKVINFKQKSKKNQSIKQWKIKTN